MINDNYFVILQTNMKVLSNIKLFALKVLRAQATKYTVVCLLGVLIVGFLDENSIWSHFKNKQRISDLNRNPKAMEKIARERYFMKADDEDIFVLSDDDREAKPIVSNETAE